LKVREIYRSPRAAKRWSWGRDGSERESAWVVRPDWRGRSRCEFQTISSATEQGIYRAGWSQRSQALLFGLHPRTESSLSTELPRLALLQARRESDPARKDEHAAFAARLGLPLDAVACVDILEATLDGRVLEGADGLLVGGAGEFSVLDSYDPIRRFVDFLAQTASEGTIPIFASCFGFQALVLGLGGEVVADEDHAEVGSYQIHLTAEGQQDAFFGELPSQFMAQLGHKDRASRLPSQLQRMAFSERAPVQAVRMVGRPVFATQFHPELTGDDNRQRFLGYMEQYGRLFGAEEAQRRLDSHVDSPESNALLRRFLVGHVSPASSRAHR
jgi:GMP synthase (glutamine-hydrolysing)